VNNPCQYCETEMNEDEQDVCCDGQRIIELEQENALLTKKLAGLEDIDDDRGSLIKIIEGAIEDFDGIGYQYEADGLQKKLKEAGE